jgi:hypothetical protein
MDEELQRRLDELQADGRKRWDKKIARLEAELRRLPIQEQTVPGKSYADAIPETAHELLSLAWHKRAAAAAERRRLAASVGQTLKALSPLTHDDLGYARSELARLRLELLKLHVVARRNSFKGAPKKVDVEKLTRTVAFHYRRLTGNRPTIEFAKTGKAGGPWLEHLRAVFAIVGVRSAEVQPGSRKRRTS